MRSFFSPIDPELANQTTYFNRKRAEDEIMAVAAYQVDRDSSQRQALHHCKTCWYFRLGGMAGQAFTRWNCGICGEENTHPNTDTPKVCVSCCKRHQVCTRCGGDLLDRQRRKYSWEKLSKERVQEIRQS